MPAGDGDRPPALINTNEAARRLGVQHQTLRAWRVSGRGPPFARVGSRVLYRPEDLDAWLAARIYRSTAEADAATP